MNMETKYYELLNCGLRIFASIHRDKDLAIRVYEPNKEVLDSYEITTEDIDNYLKSPDSFFDFFKNKLTNKFITDATK